jgi:predicted unusual protein kinase regulating ubiquinone biosynthesis (AarF/ABC1/UbiB family)
MDLSLNPNHLKRYQELARLFMKYGRSDLLNMNGSDLTMAEEKQKPEAVQDPKAEDLADDLERMGPIYVKMGQVLSSRSDLLPPEYVKALSRLQDDIEPFSFAEVEKTVENELGVKISKAFLEFDSTPLATASLGQVHKAVLRDGRPVVVKVQRPEIRQQVAEDLEVLHSIADFMDSHTAAGKQYHFSEVLDEFQRTLARELDYKKEANNLREIGENLKEFDTIIVPAPVEDYTTSRVLTMDYVHGRKITELGPLARLEMDGSRLAEDLFRAYLQQILVDGFFHADPHPGNIFVTDDYKIALIDLGMVGRITPGMQEQLLKLILAVADGRADDVTETILSIGTRLPEFDEAAYKSRMTEIITRNQNASTQEIQIGTVLMDFTRTASETGVRLPSELTMLGKTLLNLDELGRILDPDFNPNDAIRRDAAEITRQRLAKSLSPANIFAAAMEAKEFAQEMPRRVNKILDSLANNQLKIEVEAIDEQTLIEGAQKIANRITTGLILAALIVGASMLMRVQTRFQLFGYPGLAMICFLFAAGMGFWLLVMILLNDRKTGRGSG